MAQPFKTLINIEPEAANTESGFVELFDGGRLAEAVTLRLYSGRACFESQTEHPHF